MSSPALAKIPEGADVESLTTTFEMRYAWKYDGLRDELRSLYDKAKREQWDAAIAVDWSLDVDPERENIPDAQIPIHGTRLWDRLTPDEILKLRREQLSWTLSQFLHGEQGALLATAQIVDAAPWIEAKYFGATQVVDEARHVEAYERYLREKLGRSYPVNRHLKALLDEILTDGRWDMKYLGMQILVEGLAMAAFGFMNKVCTEPLLKDIVQNITRDEARHVAFGVLSLSGHYADMRAPELRDREEFIAEGCRLLRDRLIAEEVWEEMGFPMEEAREVVLNSPTMILFRKMLFSKIVPNVKRLGLLTPFVRQRFEELDILRFEDDESAA